MNWSCLSKRVFSLFFVAVVVGALWLRVHDIANRPFHNDEGVNYFFIEQLRELGYYPYSHENYHGPSYFYLTGLVTALLGDSELGMRGSAILVGTLTLPLLLLLLPFGRGFVLLSALLFALSPSLTFYSRYAIHETLFLFAGLGGGIALYRWLREQRVCWLYFGAVLLGVFIATKETFIITLFSLLLAALSLGGWRAKAALVRSQWQHVCWAVLLAVIVTFGFFTGLFRWMVGLREMLLAVPQWIGRGHGDTGHFKPFEYYAKIFLQTEPVVFLAVVLPLVALLVQRWWPALQPSSALPAKSVSGKKGGGKPPQPAPAMPPAATSTPIDASDELLFIRYLSVWAATSFLVYSAVQYKTPWLIINLTAPLLLCAAWWMARLGAGTFRFRFAYVGVGLLAVVLQGARMVEYVFQLPYGSGNPFSYVHTTAGMVELMSDIERYWEKHPGAMVLIGVNGYWPLPYYVRNHKQLVHYVSSDDVSAYKDRYDILVMDRSVDWQDGGWARKYYRLSDVQESHTFFRRHE